MSLITDSMLKWNGGLMLFYILITTVRPGLVPRPDHFYYGTTEHIKSSRNVGNVTPTADVQVVDEMDSNAFRDAVTEATVMLQQETGQACHNGLPCLRGECIAAADGLTACHCETPFDGDRCQFVQLYTSTLNVGIGTLGLSWDEPVNLTDFSAVIYILLGNETSVLLVEVTMTDTRTYTIHGILGGGAVNTVCLEHRDAINSTLDSLRAQGPDEDIRSRCLRVLGYDTFPRPLKYAVFAALALLALMIIVMMCCRGSSDKKQQDETDTSYSKVLKLMREAAIADATTADKHVTAAENCTAINIVGFDDNTPETGTPVNTAGYVNTGFSPEEPAALTQSQRHIGSHLSVALKPNCLEKIPE